MKNNKENDTIVAQATPPGRGGVGILRISGALASAVAQAILNKLLPPRYAHYLKFYDEDSSILDQGIALYFKGPHSFTGEDILELQGHGGPIVLDLLLKRILALPLPGLRIARPGEFLERAFLNNKIDLTQAEAVADLINANSEQAARSAVNSLQGVFSDRIKTFSQSLIDLRAYVEAAMDFSEEEINFLSDGKIEGQLNNIINELKKVQAAAHQGSLLREGMKVVIAGRPNAGKSSLLNALAGKESAIVTAVAGTTRDVLREYIHIDGMPLHIIDTAGLRETSEIIEKIGIERAWHEIENADSLLFIVDSSATEATLPDPELIACLPTTLPIIVVRNKIDMTDEQCGLTEVKGYPVIRLSAKTGQGIENLQQYLKQSMGFTQHPEGHFLARRRHLDALEKALKHLNNGHEQLMIMQAGELLAEELRLAQSALEEITGEFSSDDLLGEIFSNFCIGK
ncbi:tRNA uridine-5-carboxymethylaminomethyl(34) synthesis GTPase MnmE [Candidatus Regiella insecticola]|uniref:tRNA modification GTPase MnmE n=1 Tax=Candidatus Regiella insecticola TaxID=138073 RepID=A0A6L2ZK06_9ENTR|nr:tRNA uridine-5-carboxymethylaminomethyl(34) synthesis GTPase MnmE [Candidatus Regiella insecticola]GFN45173.1 tRNA modification GTPase MnmE [Candidatus Regiella insecticola]